MKKIDKLKTIPIIDNVYLVPCFIEKLHGGYDQNFNYNNKPTIIPVYNLPHDDKENNQPFVHYHVDTRFDHNDNWKKYNLSFGSGRIPIRNFGKQMKLKYYPLKYATHEERTITNNSYIKNSKIKGCRIKNNKCPHKGFDLSQVPIDKYGYKHCPMHGTMVNKNGIAS